jgi:hypothetical protein
MGLYSLLEEATLAGDPGRLLRLLRRESMGS